MGGGAEPSGSSSAAAHRMASMPDVATSRPATVLSSLYLEASKPVVRGPTFHYHRNRALERVELTLVLEAGRS